MCSALAKSLTHSSSDRIKAWRSRRRVSLAKVLNSRSRLEDCAAVSKARSLSSLLVAHSFLVATSLYYTIWCNNARPWPPSYPQAAPSRQFQEGVAWLLQSRAGPALPGVSGYGDPRRSSPTALNQQLRPMQSCQALVWHPFYNLTRLSRSAFVITDTELKLIAAAAMTGESRIPKNGYSRPAAIGTPSEL